MWYINQRARLNLDVSMCSSSSPARFHINRTRWGCPHNSIPSPDTVVHQRWPAVLPPLRILVYHPSDLWSRVVFRLSLVTGWEAEMLCNSAVQYSNNNRGSFVIATTSVERDILYTSIHDTCPCESLRGPRPQLLIRTCSLHFRYIGFLHGLILK